VEADAAEGHRAGRRWTGDRRPATLSYGLRRRMVLLPQPGRQADTNAGAADASLGYTKQERKEQ
jgi:hypothetical protein